MALHQLLDVGRIIYVIIAGLLSSVLCWRATRWAAKFREPAWLHISAMFYSACGVYIGYHNLGKAFTIMYPLNFLGTFCLAIFILYVPEEKPQTWREQRGEPPDWNERFKDL